MAFKEFGLSLRNATHSRRSLPALLTSQATRVAAGQQALCRTSVLGTLETQAGGIRYADYIVSLHWIENHQDVNGPLKMNTSSSGNTSASVQEELCRFSPSDPTTIQTSSKLFRLLE